MILLMLLTVVLGALIIFAAWSAVHDSLEARAAAAPGPAGETLTGGPGSLEGVLVAQLDDGEITRTQYRRAMAKIASREEERSPMSVPTDD